MNEQLKKAILKTIEYSTVEYICMDGVRTYSVSTPEFVVYIEKFKSEYTNGYCYQIQLNKTFLLSEHISRKYAIPSPDQRAALEIWDVVAHKYIQQQLLKAQTQKALNLMKNYIAAQERTQAIVPEKTR